MKNTTQPVIDDPKTMGQKKGVESFWRMPLYNFMENNNFKNMEQKKHIKPCLQSAKIAIPTNIQDVPTETIKILHSPPMAPPIPRHHGIANLALEVVESSGSLKA